MFLSKVLVGLTRRPGASVVVMGASTGGPGVLRDILEQLPASFSVPTATFSSREAASAMATSTGFPP